jgi:hypothetical protein
MQKCDWCPNEFKNGKSNGRSKFCSKKCMHEFYKQYPNTLRIDNIIQGFINLIIWIIIIYIIVTWWKNTGI